jgi:phosphate starvation-inducible protein PhoH
MVLTGDNKQSDIFQGITPYANVIAKIKNIDGIGLQNMDESDIIRSDIIAKILRALET